MENRIINSVKIYWHGEMLNFIYDKLDIVVKNGMICMISLVVYPKAYIDELNTEIKVRKTTVYDSPFSTKLIFCRQMKKVV